jgi:hypothetical protein
MDVFARIIRLLLKFLLILALLLLVIVVGFLFTPFVVAGFTAAADPLL